MISIHTASFPTDTVCLRSLIDEYVRWLDLDLSYQGFDDEMAQLESRYSPPNGLFLLARVDGEPAGCVGLKRMEEAGAAEVKRLYVRPAHRGLRIGGQLVEALKGRAAQMGFSRLLLDAVPQTAHAQRLYVAIGFREIAPYYPTPVAGTKFYELGL
jgi:carbonic anhydrase